MECNKNDALMAKEMAEKKLTEKDFIGAQRLALKARNLFAGLDGLSKLLEVINVFVSSQKKANGEVDWYAVLGVDSSVDDETLRKHYRRMALALHPDKNKSTGADGAFAILSQAWSILSDKAKRASYDQRRSVQNVFHNPMCTPSARPVNSSTATGQNVFHNPMCTPGARPGNPSMATGERPNIQPASMPPRPPVQSTFWTKCNRCGMHFEYSRVYLNKFLICTNCRFSYWAREGSAPERTSCSLFGQQRPNPNFPASSQPNASGLRHSTPPHMVKPMQSGPVPSTWANIHHGNGMSSAATQATSDIHQTGETLSSSEKQGRPIKKRRMNEQKLNSERKGTVSQMAAKSGIQANVSRNPKVVSETNRPKRLREFSQSQMRNKLIEKAVLEIRKKVNEWNVSDAATKALLKEETVMKKPTATATASVALDSVKDSMKGNNVDGAQHNNCSVSAEPNDEDSIAAQVLSMTVPDPDFHDFDDERVESSFAENQVWAAYDDDDGMPRYYAMVRKVISKTPFKTSISWLNSKSNAELGPINWVASGFPKTSGDFWIGKWEVCTSLNNLSHKVKWTKGSRGVIQIYPGKGDVWALYKNWSREWNTFTPDNEIHSYEMVQLLEDFTNNQVSRVVPLIKVPGYRSVFKAHADPTKIWSIPKEEIFRFSHQVPSYVLTGEEAPNAPRGFLELDPAALPPDLLQVITEAMEVEKDTSGEVKPDESDTRSDSKENEPSSFASRPLVTYSRRPKGTKATAKTGGETKE